MSLWPMLRPKRKRPPSPETPESLPCEQKGPVFPTSAAFFPDESSTHQCSGLVQVVAPAVGSGWSLVG